MQVKSKTRKLQVIIIIKNAKVYKTFDERAGG